MKKIIATWCKNLWLYLLGVLLIVNVLIWSLVLTLSPQKDLTVSFLNVGQGDAILITSRNGNQLLIDGGPNKSVLRELGKTMSFNDRVIDALITTHPDKDHIGGLPEVFKRYQIGVVLEPGTVTETAIFTEFQNEIKNEGATHLLARRGMVINFGDGAYFEILFPDREVSGLETNTSSIVGRLVYGETEFLLTGDAPMAIENYLVSLDEQNLQSDVLKVGHHGSNTSTSLSFASMVAPQYAVISAGRDNSYGHPHREVLGTLSQVSATILNTAERGTITFKSDGQNLKLK